MGFHPPCAIGSSDNSSLAFSFVSKPSKVLISRPETIINALGRGSSVSPSRTSCFSVLKSGRDAISAITTRTVGSSTGILSSTFSDFAADLKTPYSLSGIIKTLQTSSRNQRVARNWVKLLSERATMNWSLFCIVKSSLRQESGRRDVVV